MSPEPQANVPALNGSPDAMSSAGESQATPPRGGSGILRPPLKILHVIPAISARYGGPSTVVRNMASALAEREGLRVEVASTDAGLSAAERAEESAAFPVTLRLFRHTVSERWKYSRGLGRWLADKVVGFDLVHLHGVWSYATLAACRAAARADVPVLLRPCGMMSDYTFSRSSGLKAVYWRFVERPNLKSVAAFHATSVAEAEEIRRLGFTAPTEVIPNGVDPSAWTEPRLPERLPEACGRPGSPVILFLSRLHPKKGVVDLLLPAFRRVASEASLAIAGGPDGHSPWYASDVEATVDRLGLCDRTTFLGAVAGRARWSAFDGAAVFVLPSRSENFGVVVAEAMARGIPVVVTEGVQAADHVRAAGAGYVVPLDVDALADAMSRLLAAPQTRRTMGEAGREYARRTFAWGSITDRIEQLYRATLARVRPIEFKGST